MNFFWRWWKTIDKPMTCALCVLLVASIVLVTTASPVVASRIGLDESHFVIRHLFYLSLAIFVIFGISCSDKYVIRDISFVGFTIVAILLLLTQFYGYEVKGARRWISIFGLSIQPSEFVKPFFAVVTGVALSRNHGKRFSGFITSLFLYCFVIGCLATQPDFGMLVVISAVWGVQLFISGMPIIWIIVSVILGAIGTVVAYTALPHVASRINNFLDPSAGENYQVSKSLMAFSGGGFIGKGPGEGTVKQVLPDSHTDFIFAVAGEELGAIICIFIALTFAFIVVRGLFMIAHDDDAYVVISSAGLLAQFGLQSVVNMCVTLNLMPTKGMTLPFISYGGSSTIAIGIAIGMLLAFTKKQCNLTRYKTRFSKNL